MYLLYNLNDKLKAILLIHNQIKQNGNTLSIHSSY